MYVNTFFGDFMRKGYAILIFLVLVLIISNIISYWNYLGVPGRSNGKREVTFTWDKEIIVNLLYPKNPTKGVIDFTIYLNIKTPVEVRSLAFYLYIYEMKSEGLKLIKKMEVKSGINKVTFKLPYKLLGRKVIRENIKEPFKKVGNTTLYRVIGVRYRFIPVYEPTHIMFHVIRFSVTHKKWYFGSLALSLTPLNMSQTFEIRIRKIASEPVSENEVPAPGQNHNQDKTHKVWGIDSISGIYVKVTPYPDNPIPLYFPSYERVYYYNPNVDQWYREDWIQTGEMQIYCYVPGYDDYDGHLAGYVKIKYTCYTTEYSDRGWRFIVVDVWASEFLTRGQTSWSTSPGGDIINEGLMPGGTDNWKAYETTQLSLEGVSLTFTLISISEKTLILPVPIFHFKVEKNSLKFYVKNNSTVTVVIYDKHAKAFIKICEKS